MSKVIVFLTIFFPILMFPGTFSISGSFSPNMHNSGTVAGQDPTTIVDDSLTYSVSPKKNLAYVTARLSTPLPANTTLKVELMGQKKPLAESAGEITLTTSEQIVVSNLEKKSYENLQLKYTFSANASAGVLSFSQGVIYTLYD